MKYEAPKIEMLLNAEDSIMGSLDSYTLNLWDILIDA